MQNSITGNASQTGELYGEFTDLSPGAGELVYGNNIQIGNTGTGVRYANYARVQIPAGASSAYGTFYRMEHTSAANIYGSFIDFNGAGAGNRYAYYTNMGTGAGQRYGIYLDGASTNFIGGNLGVGDVTSPGSALHVRNSGSPVLMVESSTTGSASLNLRNTNTTWSLRNLNGELDVLDGATNRLTIEASGEVGIGTQNPTSRLEVVGNIEIPAANDYIYSSNKTKYLHVPNIAYTLMSTSLTGARVEHATTGIFARIYGTTGTGKMAAPIYLPDSAVITELRVYLNNGSATNSSVEIFRYGGTGALGTALASISVNNTTGLQTFTDNTITNATIDNENYFYYVVYTGAATTTFDNAIYGTRITYTVTKAD